MALKRDEAELTTGFVMGTFLVSNKPAYVLFDSGTCHSFIASLCVSKLLLYISLEINNEFAKPFARESYVSECIGIYP